MTRIYKYVDDDGNTFFERPEDFWNYTVYIVLEPDDGMKLRNKVTGQTRFAHVAVLQGTDIFWEEIPANSN